MDVIKFTDLFFAMEKELDLFSKRANGVLWWDPVRHDLFNLIYSKLSSATQAPPPRIGLPRRVVNWGSRKALGLILRTKLKLGHYSVLVFRAPRHLSLSGARVDVILDDILACIPGKKLIINTFPHYYHICLPVKSESSLRSEDLCNLNSEVFSRFGCEIDAESFIKLAFNQYEAAQFQYDKLLKQAAPKFVLMIQNGIQKALYSAARKRLIPVIEAQHGLINYAHPAYSYPRYIAPGTLETLPTIFFSFSEYWSTKCHYPVEKIVATGNRQFSVSPCIKYTDDVLVISSVVHEESIEGVLLPVANHLKNRRFIYKLHPNQFSRIIEIKERLAGSPNVEVISNKENLQQLFARCESVFCINSTGVYEALQAGLSVYLLNKQDYQKHSDVFNYPRVKVVSGHVDLIQVLTETRDDKSLPTDVPVFFHEFDATSVKNSVKGLFE